MKNNKRTSVDEALALFLTFAEPVNRSIMLPLEDTDDRVLSKDIIAPMDYPHYDQCILDGYAVQAADTAGCREGSERAFSLSAGGHVRSGFCTVAHTGSTLPFGADALLPLENATEKNDYILASKEVTKGEWIWPRGGGLREGDVVSKEGMQLKPVDIAMLAKLGVTHVEVYDRPHVLIVPTGDECINRCERAKPGPGFVYETNGLMCSLLVKRSGGYPTLHDIVPDDETQLGNILMKGTGYDLVVTIGGSSASKRDLMEQVISSLGKVLFHGVSLHPGNHMGAGFVRNGENKIPVIFLPGYTESCAVATFTFVDAAVKRLGHYPSSRYAVQQAQLTEKVTTSLGIRAVRKVNICDGKAQPIKMLGESAHEGMFGYIVVPEDRSVFEAGEFVDVIYIE
jgi:molybdopterin molybdotransferase